MVLTDTHTHLYLDKFAQDRKLVIENAIENDVRYMMLPNIDRTSIDDMLNLCDSFPDNCFPMIGLHPGSVNKDYKNEIAIVEKYLTTKKFYAIGEIGIDLYWDKTFYKEQEIAFSHQIQLALKYKLPIVVHSRESFDEIIKIIKQINNPDLRGVFHCFTGTLEQAQKVISLGFKIGIGGVVTFKNSGLDKVVKEINLEHIVLETDSPFLAPVPYRGKRNESSYIFYIAKKIAEIKNLTVEEVAETTTNNAGSLFKFIECNY